MVVLINVKVFYGSFLLFFVILKQMSIKNVDCFDGVSISGKGNQNNYLFHSFTISLNMAVSLFFFITLHFVKLPELLKSH